MRRKLWQERVRNHEKIEVLFEHNVTGLFGENGVEGMSLVKRWGEPDEERYTLPVDGFISWPSDINRILISLNLIWIRMKWDIS